MVRGGVVQLRRVSSITKTKNGVSAATADDCKKMRRRPLHTCCLSIPRHQHTPFDDFIVVKMKFSFKLSNIFGSVYHTGTLAFSPDGYHLLSPVGNKVISYDLKNNRSQSLGLEGEYNVTRLSLHPNGRMVLAATEKTHLYMFSLVAGTILHRKEFRDLGDTISVLSFSPDGEYYVVAGGNKALIYTTPSANGKQMNPFMIHKVIKAHFEDVTCVSWSPKSLLVAIGSKDFSVKIVPVDKKVTRAAKILNLAGHSDIINNCFFLSTKESPLDLISISRNGQLYLWDSSLKSPDQLFEDNSEDTTEGPPLTLRYTRSQKYFLTEHVKEKGKKVNVSSVDYNSKMKLLVTGFSNGCFLLQDVPEFNVIYSLQLSTSGPVDSIVINNTGEWIALGSGIGAGTCDEIDPGSGRTSNSQLVVWEWKTETFVLKQSGTGAGKANLSECSCFSPDALTLATGGTDAKIRLYDTMTGFCFVTFGNEHKGPITCLEFAPNKGGKVLVSASLDGTVRCFDLNRYRNFKTFSGPSQERSPQFISLAIDPLSGDFVAAGAQNLFDIYMWSQQTGRLVEVLSGHQAPVSGIKFTATGSDLISCSWDGTVRIWSLFQGTKATREIIKVGVDCTHLAMNPPGTEIAVSTLNGQVFFFDSSEGEQLGAPIEGRADLEITQSVEEDSRDKHKYFTSMSYSSDGEYLLAGGNSKYICLYHVKEKILAKKFAVTWNLSMDGMYDYISKRKRAEFGFHQQAIRDRLEGQETSTIALPGVKRGDLSERSVQPVIAVSTVVFSPTMRSFVSTTTEGVLLYSLDAHLLFDPFGLEVGITEDTVRERVRDGEFLDALIQSIKMNEASLVREVLESIPAEDIPFVSSSMPPVYLEPVLRHIALGLDTSPHLEFYLDWSSNLLRDHGVLIKNTCSKAGSMQAVLRLLSRNLSRHLEDIGKVVDTCRHTLSLITSFHSDIEKKKVMPSSS